MSEFTQKAAKGRTTCSSLLLYLSFITLSITVALCARSPSGQSAYLLTHAAQTAVLDGGKGSNGPIEFAHVSSREDVWLWLQSSLVTGILKGNEDSICHANKTNCQHSFNRLVGRVRLRQVRGTYHSSFEGTCQPPSRFSEVVYGCFGGIGILGIDQSKESYGPGSDSQKLTRSPFVWQSPKQLNENNDIFTYSIGQLGDIIPAGGFVALLPAKSSKAGRFVESLKSDQWLDYQTRVLLVEFNLFNANVNQLLAYRAMIEFPLSGGVLTSNNVLLSPVLGHSGNWEYFLEFLFTFVGIVLVVRLLRAVYFSGTRFFVWWRYYDPSAQEFSTFSFSEGASMRVEPFICKQRCKMDWEDQIKYGECTAATEKFKAFRISWWDVCPTVFLGPSRAETVYEHASFLSPISMREDKWKCFYCCKAMSGTSASENLINIEKELGKKSTSAEPQSKKNRKLSRMSLATQLRSKNFHQSKEQPTVERAKDASVIEGVWEEYLFERRHSTQKKRKLLPRRFASQAKWNYVDLALVLILLTIFFVRNETLKFINGAGGPFPADEYIDLRYYLSREYASLVMMAICVMVLMFKLANVFLLLPGLNLIFVTFWLATPSLLSLLTASLFILTIFAFSFYIAFGSGNGLYQSFAVSLNSLYLNLGKIGGALDYPELRAKNPTFSPLIVALFSVMGIFLLQNMFNAIIINAFNKADRRYRQERGVPTVLDAYWLAIWLYWYQKDLPDFEYGEGGMETDNAVENLAAKAVEKTLTDGKQEDTEAANATSVIIELRSQLAAAHAELAELKTVSLAEESGRSENGLANAVAAEFRADSSAAVNGGLSSDSPAAGGRSDIL